MKPSSGLAVNPCPTDLLGRQRVFMHMSAHYRRTYSAQSVVDSAPPASLLAKRERAMAATPRTRSRRPRPHTVAECPEGPGPGSGWPSRLGLAAKPASAGAGAGGAAQAQVIQQVLVRQSVRAQRSAQLSSKPIRVYPKPSRAETDPGQVSRRPLDYGGAGGGHTPPRRPAGAPRLRRKEHEKSTTFFDKLSQLGPRKTHGQSPRARTNSELLAEALTPAAPHKPRVLRTEVPSRLRYSNCYCPPRPKSSHRTRLEVAAMEYGPENPASQPTMWPKPYSSPPVSSRDSAYNGGISSGGESRGPTPDHKNDVTKKNGRKSDKKGIKKKSENRRALATDCKTRKRLEKRLKRRLLEDEREELHGQRIHTEAWRSVSEEDHGDEIVDAEEDLYQDSQAGDDSFMEEATPNEESSQVDAGSKSDQSVEEDMEEVEEEESTEQHLIERQSMGENREDTEVCVRNDKTHSENEELVQEKRRESQLTVTKQQISTQTDISLTRALSTRSSPVENDRGKRKGSLPQMVDNSCQLSASSTSKSLSQSASRISSKSQPIMKSAAVSCSTVNEYLNGGCEELREKIDKEINPSKTIKYRENASEPSELTEKTESSTDRKIEMKPHYALFLQTEDNITRSNAEPYIRLIHDITEDIRVTGVVTNKALKAVFQKHMDANRGKLDSIRMQQEVDKLRLQLEVPKDDHLDGLNYGMGSSLDVEHLSPMTSRQSDFWDPRTMQTADLHYKMERGSLSHQKKELLHDDNFFSCQFKVRENSQPAIAPRDETFERKSTETDNAEVRSGETRCSNSNLLGEDDNIKKMEDSRRFNEENLPSTTVRSNATDGDDSRAQITSRKSFLSQLSLVSPFGDLQLSGTDVRNPSNSRHSPAVNELPRYSNLQDQISILSASKEQNRNLGVGTFINAMTVVDNKIRKEVVSNQTDFTVRREVPSTGTVPTSSRSNSPHGIYAEFSCVCKKSECTCTSKERITGFLQKWVSEGPVSEKVPSLSDILKLGDSCLSSALCNSPEPSRKPRSIDTVVEEPSKARRNCKCRGEQCQSTDGVQCLPNGKETVVTLFAPNENFASTDSMSEEPMDVNKVQKVRLKCSPKAAFNAKFQQGLLANDFENLDFGVLLSPDGNLPKTGHFIEEPNVDLIPGVSKTHDTKDQHFSSPLFGTGINSDILHYTENLPP